ncbi:programmed cell death protein 2 [Mucor lusitanicus]|uniref:Programmed cell death protein 2 n=1 Tax=Mucor circinelloides f. lusitanicus TaxID=29924 RepID=A0A8H4F4Q9_MUCCL|nr:programmed cell death protein 2 [Mucor lusitanicus]
MSNKKQQTKKEPSVLLGIPDGDIEVDNDAYITKLGGLPVWLEPSKPPSSKVCECRICHNPMYLIFQSYVPLQESPYHRVLYVWACNRRSCMRKEGSFSVIRSHVVDPAYLKAQRQKEEEKRKKEEKKKAAAAKQQQAFGNGFQLGDLWGNSAGSFGSAPSTGGGFGMKKPTAASIVASTPFGAPPAKKNDTSQQDLVAQMSEMGIQDPVDTATLPQFPGQYLYIDEERTDNYESMGIDMSRYKEYLDMEKEMLMDIDEGSSNGETWQGETYEKQHLPKGVDKQFKKFTERVECAPSQCVRYEFNGQPLFYTGLRPQDQQLITSPCKYCKGPRVFEFQLMPNVLSILPTTEFATKDLGAAKPIDAKVKNVDAKTVLDSWNVGMEFGTILVFVCQKDCHQGSIEDVSYMEETALVQYETD